MATIAYIPFIKKNKKEREIKNNFISPILMYDTIEIKNNKKDNPVITIDENSNISPVIFTPPFFISIIYKNFWNSINVPKNSIIVAYSL